MPDISSTGITRVTPGYGTTCRKDVLRGVDVPVVPGAAGRASPLPGGQGQAREQVPARRAGLGRGVPAVDDDKAAAVPLALVFKLAAELALPAVGDGTGQAVVADHVGDVEVFDHDGVSRANIARVIERFLETRRTNDAVSLAAAQGHPIPSRPEGRGIIQEAW